MRITQFTLQHFRAIADMELHFSTQTTALVGVNGVGKSSVLDALAIALSSMTSRFLGQAKKSRTISLDDIQVGTEYARLSIAIDMGKLRREPEPLTWALAQNRKAGKYPAERQSDLDELNRFAAVIALQLEVLTSFGDMRHTIPLAAYYDVHRAVLDVPMRIRKSATNFLSDAYEDALGHGGTDFRGFFEWFRAKEDSENEQIRDEPTFLDKDLSAVRRAIELFTGFTKLRIRRKPSLRMTLLKNGVELNVLQLSDGEKCMLALVGDLARRLSLLNSGLDDPLHGYGIVLIDEIDLHLHPKWQRTVVASLERTFPNCQFIISTHSPQIIGELPADGVILLKDGRSLGNPERSLGLSSSEVIEEMMEGEARNVGVRDDLRAIDDAIEREDITQAKLLLSQLQAKVGEIPEVLKAQLSIASLAWLEEDGK